MTYEEAKGFIEDCNQYAGGEISLKALTELLRRLGNPQDKLKFIHIAGTNGKGSVLAYISTVLKEAGYCVGRYISPTLFSYRERIQVNEAYISKEDLVRLTEKIKKAGEEMLADGCSHPTMFEVETALAFLYFVEQKCDLVTLECGRGGLTDATNVIKNTLLAVFASISMDHIGVLGNTLAEIAQQKAGILKKDCTVVTIKQKPEAEEVLLQEAKKFGCSVFVANPELLENQKKGLLEQYFDYKQWKQMKISLAGEYQFANAVLALEVFEVLKEKGYFLSEEAIRRGMEKTQWRGRFSILAKKPLFIVDGAHNEDAAQKLAESIETYFPKKRLIFLMAVLEDKEFEVVIRKTVPYASYIITTMTPDNPRALCAEDLAETVEKYHSQVECIPSIAKAVERAYELAGEEDVILSFGSLSHLGEISKQVEERKGK